MSSSSSRATSQIEIPARMEMPIFLCPRFRADVDRRVSRTPKNKNRLFYVWHDEGVTCFFLWVDVLTQTLLNVQLDEHGEWLPMLPGTEAAAVRPLENVGEGGAHIDREVAVELRRLNQKIRNLKDQEQIPICNYICAFVCMAVALVETLKFYGKA
ncbi:unnamed protein product [Alopecurus aequalis]